MNIILTTKELYEWKDNLKTVYASDSKRKKKLIYTGHGNYEVWHDDKMMHESMHAFDAVRIYNEI